MTASVSDDRGRQSIPGLRSVVGASVRGAAHVRDGRPNQDAMCWHPESGRARRVVVAVSDGHGSPKCFRSDAGSSMAVTAAVALGGEFLDDMAAATRSATEDRARTVLAAAIVDRWTRDVIRAIGQRPFTDEELVRVGELTGSQGRQAVDDNALLAYGATLLLAVVSETNALFLQLGDGDILTVGLDGRTVRPMVKDPRLFANETTSLCMPRAAGEFRVGSQPLSDEEPAAAVLATDGFANAYPDEESFLRVGPDVVAHVREEGLGAVAERLEGWLGEASRHSGDDVTAAVVWFGAPSSAWLP